MNMLKRIGSFDRMSGPIQIVTDGHYFYFCKDPERFESVGHEQRYYQRIDRIVSQILLYGGNKVMKINTYSPEAKDTLMVLKGLINQDENLKAIAAICEHAASHDFEKFYDCTAVTAIEELQELGSSLSSRLCFPGTGYALVKGIFRLDRCTEREKVFIQIVHNHRVGYTVEHLELTPALYAFSALGSVRDFFTQQKGVGEGLVKDTGDIPWFQVNQ